MLLLPVIALLSFHLSYSCFSSWTILDILYFVVFEHVAMALLCKHGHRNNSRGGDMEVILKYEVQLCWKETIETNSPLDYFN